MASLTKKDQSTLYERARQLGHQSWEIDQWADQLALAAIPTRAEAHRNIAKMMRDEAEECRSWADGIV